MPKGGGGGGGVVGSKTQKMLITFHFLATLNFIYGPLSTWLPLTAKVAPTMLCRLTTFVALLDM